MKKSVFFLFLFQKLKKKKKKKEQKGNKNNSRTTLENLRRTLTEKNYVEVLGEP